MFEVARYEGERRLVLGATIAVAASFYGAMFVALAPSFTDFDVEALFAGLPQQFTEGLGISAIDTLPGLLAVELFQVGWVLVLGLYLAYSAASMIAGDVASGRMDTLLSAPVSRSKLVVEEFSSLLVPILAVNAITPIVLYAGSVIIDDPLVVENLVMLHALAVPYLLCCAAVGFAFSVFLTDEDLAQIASIGVLVVAFLIETLLIGTDYEVLGVIAPMNYFDPTEILVDGTFDWAGGAILLAAAAVLVFASQWRFTRMDI
ncbi:ABC transporter permease subunit [Halococcus agarilyticus]|uniref:ABC transporter permease subunit n=1 Tax=Halococcus agarilyticus TaxID=1232219 RepID=UPI0006780801|nr:ABC transporter permease subunit [Halococcus agarilyticus]